MKYRNLGKNLLAGLAISASGSAIAAGSAVDELLKALYQNGTIDKATYELVQKAAKAEDEQNRTQIREISVAESHKAAGDALAKSKAGKPTVTMGGKIQLDAGAVNEDIAAHNSGTEIRRARFFAKGTLDKDWGYKLQYEFASTKEANIDGILDAYIDYKPLNIRIGHFEEPFSLQNMTSDKYVTFTERAMSNIFTEGRNIGIQHIRTGDNWMIAGGIFGDGRSSSSETTDEGWGVSARGTIAPVNTENQKLHLGLSLAQRYTGDDGELNYSDRPETHITSKKIVSTGNIKAHGLTRGALEAAFVSGPWHTAAEYYHTDIDRNDAGLSDLTFTGYYVETGLFLTNDQMNYSGKGGKFGKISPNGDNGAWQIAARLSNIDLNDADITGGEADSLTLGLNWFATPSIRFSANYVNILDVDGGITTTPGDNPEAFTLRSQVAF